MLQDKNLLQSLRTAAMLDSENFEVKSTKFYMYYWYILHVGRSCINSRFVFGKDMGFVHTTNIEVRAAGEKSECSSHNMRERCLLLYLHSLMVYGICIQPNNMKTNIVFF